jgi:hypothetical protein
LAQHGAQSVFPNGLGQPGGILKNADVHDLRYHARGIIHRLLRLQPPDVAAGEFRQQRTVRAQLLRERSSQDL